MPSDGLHVLVAGGGIGGLCLAQALRKAGISVAVYERDTAPDANADRYRLHINPAGSRSLHACLPPQAWQRFLETAGRTGGGFGFPTEQLETMVVVEDDIMYPPATDPAEQWYPVDRAALPRSGAVRAGRHRQLRRFPHQLGPAHPGPALGGSSLPAAACRRVRRDAASILRRPQDARSHAHHLKRCAGILRAPAALMQE
jgi:glycine/D-amino acid oxidase-like deaminating enzyme